MLRRVDDLEGTDGELIDRLIKLMNSDALGPSGWETVSFYAAYVLRGTALTEAHPDTGEAAPGTVGEWIRQRGDVVSRDAYFGLIADRLAELVKFGLDEEFLVRSLRDAARRWLEHFGDTGTADRNRAKFREPLERALEDPAEFAAWRTRIANSDPLAASQSDEELMESLRRMVEFLKPTSAESATEAWASLARWDDQVAAILSDQVFDDWRMRRTRGFA
jgi:hypothetical protein